MQIVTGLQCKYLIYLMNRPVIDFSRKPRVKQRGPEYGSEVQYAIAKIAQALDYPASERLKPQLVPVARNLIRHGELCISRETLK